MHHRAQDVLAFELQHDIHVGGVTNITVRDDGEAADQ
jgi:hypothetical protein